MADKELIRKQNRIRQQRRRKRQRQEKLAAEMLNKRPKLDTITFAVPLDHGYIDSSEQNDDYDEDPIGEIPVYFDSGDFATENVESENVSQQLMLLNRKLAALEQRITVEFATIQSNQKEILRLLRRNVDTHVPEGKST